MRIYYDEIAKNIVLGQANRLFATGSLEASEFRGRVAVVYKDTNFRELFLAHDRIKKQDGSQAGVTLAEVLAYLNAEFNKSPFSGAEGSAGVPTSVDSGSVFSVPANTQTLFSEEITLAGDLELDGVLVEVN